MANRWGTMETATDLFSWAPKSLQMVTPAMKLKDTCSLEEKQCQTLFYFMFLILKSLQMVTAAMKLKDT